jgi:RHS repeat-associated protein
MLAEYNSSNALQRRYVFAPGLDQSIVWYEGATIDNTSRRFMSADERGSIISVTDSSGGLIGVNAYDEYGIPGSSNVVGERFGYTGQAWLPELGMAYYKARIYSPTLGRFLQTDPIGYADGANWYAYVGNDPVNFADPLGLEQIVITGTRPPCGGVSMGGLCVLGQTLNQLLERLQTRITDDNSGSRGRPETKPQNGQSQKLPQCLLNFLNRNTSGFDWSKVTLRQGGTWGGKSASTSLNTITYANWDDRNDLNLTFHELGHMPQWASGRLTKRSYAAESIGSWWHGDTWIPNKDAIWDQSTFEQEAEEFRQTMIESYKEEGSPCSPKK